MRKNPPYGARKILAKTPPKLAVFKNGAWQELTKREAVALFDSGNPQGFALRKLK
jgi:hypothetical protein